MFLEKLLARSDKMFHDHGDLWIKILSVLVAFALLGLFFLATRQTPFENTTDDIQQITQ